jgi:hypothetical protein
MMRPHKSFCIVGSIGGYYGLFQGRVASSIAASRWKASSALAPHILASAFRCAQTAGRSALPKSRHRLSSVSCTQRTPAGFPPGMPGILDEIDGTTQQAPHPARHLMCIEV